MDTALNELLTIAGCCRLYQVGRTTVYREAAAGRLKLRKLRSGTRIARADAEAWAAALPVAESKMALRS